MSIIGFGENMLRAKIYINEKQIDDICIINIGKKQKGETLYKVKAVPCDFYIWHRRKDGWEVLLMKVLEVKSKLELPSFINVISNMQKASPQDT